MHSLCPKSRVHFPTVLTAFLIAACSNPPHESSSTVTPPSHYKTAEPRIYSETQTSKQELLTSYREVATHFNKDLSGRYPFSSLSLREVNAHTVCDFFRIHATRIDTLIRNLDSLREYPATIAFLRKLDAADSFLGGTACSRFNQPIHILFRPLETASNASNPPHAWKLSNGFIEAHAPHGIPTLNWGFKAPLSLEVTWNQESGLRPRPARSGNKYEMPDSSTIRFTAHGDWALMRFIDTHRAKWQRGDDFATTLEFFVDVASRPPPSTSPHSFVSISDRALLTVQLWFEYTERDEPRERRKWPTSFPTIAP
jgi:hypothetical protein